MTKTITLSLSLGSGPKAEALASRIKSWAAGRHLSEVIRNTIIMQMDKEGFDSPKDNP